MGRLSDRLLFYTTEQTLVPRSALHRKATSGTTYSLVHVAHALADQGLQVAVAGPVKDSFEEDNVTYLPCPDNAALFDCLDRTRSDTLIIVGHAVEKLSAAAPCRIKTFLWMHNWSAPSEVIEQISRLRLEAVFMVSRYHLAYYLVRSWRKPSLWRRSRAIPNPLGASPAFNGPALLPSNDKELRIAFVGRPSKGKGFDKVCELMAELQRLSSKPCVLHVFGDPGLYGTRVEADTDLNAYSPCVHHGNLARDELYPKLAACHFAVSGLSGSETFCLSLLEAAACGVVPATLNSGGQISFLDRSNALVADKLESLPTLIANAADDPDLYKRLARKAHRLPETFQPKRVAEDWIRALSGKRRSPGHCKMTFWFLTSRLLRFLRTRFR